jgi:hypothetical protein
MTSLVTDRAGWWEATKAQKVQIAPRRRDKRIFTVGYLLEEHSLCMKGL